MDKIKLFLALLVIGFLIGGCAPPTEPEVVEEPEPEPQPEPIVVEPEPEPVIKKEMTDELKAIIAKSSRVNSMEFRYRSPAEKQITYWFKGDLVKGSYISLREYNDFSYYHVYLNTKDKTAYLVCDDYIECRGNKAMAVAYSMFAPPDSPLDVVNSIEFGQITEHTQIDNKDSVIVSHINPDGNQERLWIWKFWGLPLQFEVTQAGEKVMYYYNGLVVNGVMDGDVTMPTNLELI